MTLERQEAECKHIRVERGRCVFCRKAVAVEEDDENCFPEWNLSQESMQKYSLEVAR